MEVLELELELEMMRLVGFLLWMERCVIPEHKAIWSAARLHWKPSAA